jgi:hypothetical protein
MEDAVIGERGRRVCLGREKQAAMPDLKEFHAKIGQQALEIDFLAGALGRVGDASAKK